MNSENSPHAGLERLVVAPDERGIVLKTEDLHMVYRMGSVNVPALDGINIEVCRGEFVSIMGNSGCGKSTLLHIIGGLLTPTGGRVIVEGRDLTRMTDAERTELRRKAIGFVFQQFNLFPTLTVKGNLKLAESIYSIGRTDTVGDSHHRLEILRMLNLQDKINHKPTELSGGEQQRVALARAIINKPAILLADEPTGNLDSEHSGLILRMLRGLNQTFGQTILLTTHNPEVAKGSNRIVWMKDGRIVG